MFTIVGSGFGLYGYLPALVEGVGGPVLLPRAYRDKVTARAELAPYVHAIRWVDDAASALSDASGAVIALPPEQQPEAISRCLALPGIKTLVLEKPLAATPARAASVLDDLTRSGKRFRIGYTFLDTAWAARPALAEAARSAGGLAIEWSFLAHHFAKGLQGWKRNHAQGGGVLRFFGIHLVALLAHLGYRDVVSSTLAGESPAQPERWSAVLVGPGLAGCSVSVDTRSPVERLRITARATPGTAPCVDLREPFELEAARVHRGADRRVGVLEQLLGTLGSDDAAYLALYLEVQRLWQRIEAASARVAGQGLV